jgi:hypothetical protein
MDKWLMLVLAIIAVRLVTKAAGMPWWVVLGFTPIPLIFFIVLACMVGYSFLH